MDRDVAGVKASKLNCWSWLSQSGGRTRKQEEGKESKAAPRQELFGDLQVKFAFPLIEAIGLRDSGKGFLHWSLGHVQKDTEGRGVLWERHKLQVESTVQMI